MWVIDRCGKISFHTTFTTSKLAFLARTRNFRAGQIRKVVTANRASHSGSI